MIIQAAAVQRSAFVVINQVFRVITFDGQVRVPRGIAPASAMFADEAPRHDLRGEDAPAQLELDDLWDK